MNVAKLSGMMVPIGGWMWMSTMGARASATGRSMPPPRARSNSERAAGARRGLTHPAYAGFFALLGFLQYLVGAFHRLLDILFELVLAGCLDLFELLLELPQLFVGQALQVHHAGPGALNT